MKKKRLIVLLSGIMIGVNALSISFSLAWSAYATRLNVEEIEMRFKGDKQLRISTSPNVEDFKERLERGVDNLNEVELFKPVSSMYSDEWTSINGQTPLFRDCTATSVDAWGNPQDAEYVTDGYYSQELYLMCDDDVIVTLNQKTTVMKANETENARLAKTMVGFYEGKSEQDILDGLNSQEKCLRMSILLPDEDCYQYTIIDPYKDDKDVYFAGALDNVTDRYYDYYNGQDGERYEVIYGNAKNKEKAVYDECKEQDIEKAEGDYTIFNARTMANVHRFNLEKSLENGLDVEKEKSYSLEEIDVYETPLAIPLYRNKPRKIVLSIYLEGWDKLNTNITMGSNFTCDIAFKVLREMAL